MGPEAVEPVQVAFAALPLGRSGPQIGGARPSPGGASAFSSFLRFWGGVSFTFWGRSGLESCTPRSGVLSDPPTPSSSSFPGANFQERAFQVPGGGGSEPGAGAGAAAPGARAARTPAPRRQCWSPPPPPPPRGRALAHPSPRGRRSEKEPGSGWPLPFECGFLSPSPLLLPSLSNRSLFMIAWITEEEISSLPKERCHTKRRSK